MSPPSHPQAEELASFIAGQLEAERRAAIVAHLEGCEHCRGEVKTLSVLKLGATASDDPGNESIEFARTVQRPVPGALPLTRSEESLAAVADVALGQEIGRYVVTGELGRGAMGVVLAAQDPRLQRKVAIKLLRPDVPVVESAQLRERLVREAQALALLSHPNVMPVHDVGDFRDSVFIAMDYVEGETLTDWMRFGKRSWQEVVRVMRQAGQGLAAAHRAGLVHRDFKPDNVLVGRDGHVRVSDFGVSRRVRTTSETDDEQSITGARALVGTPNYMSPEQFDARQADARSDQFSFCVAFYEALYGKLPFGGANLRERLDAVHQGPDPTQPRGSDVPAWLHALVLKGLSPNPEARFPSMEALLAVLASPPLDKRVVAGVGAAVLAVLSLTGWLTVREVQRRRGDLCLSAAERLANVWSPEASASVKKAIEGTGKPYAATTWKLAEGEMAHFIEVWNREYQASCALERSSDIRATTSARLTQLCLESRLDSVRLVVEEAKSEALKLDTWLPTLEELSAFESCAESDPWLEPEDPAQRERFREVRAEIEKARMLVNLGRELVGLPLAQQATTAARAQGFRRLEADGLFVQATATRRLGHTGDAANLYEASALAAEAGRADALLFDARLEGAITTTSELSLEKGKAAVPGVRTALERVGATRRRMLDLQRLEVIVATQEGRLDEAVALQRKLVDDTIAVMGDASFRVADEYRILALCLNRANQTDEALKVAQQHLELVRKLYGDDHPFVGQSWSTLATVLGKVQRNEEALAATQEALERLEPGDDRREYQTTLYNSGLTYRRLKRVPEAQQAMEAALAIQGSAPDVVHAQMLSGLAELLQETGQLEKALDLANRAVKMKEKIYGPGSIHMTAELSAYGSILEALGRHDEAAAVLKQTLEILEKSNAKPMLTEITRYEWARVMWNTPEKRAEAVKLVKSVSEWFHAKGPNYKEYYDEADDWLLKHPPK